MNDYDVFLLFQSLKLHFTTEKYSFFKYHGKTNATKDSFSARRDRFQYSKLARRVDSLHIRDHIIANLICGKLWIGQFLEDDATDNYLEYAKRNQSLSYNFMHDLDTLFNEYPPEVAFKSVKGETPGVISCYVRKEIGPETFTLLNHYIGFGGVFDDKLSDDYLWSKYRYVAHKLYPFLEYDELRMRSILKDKINEHGRQGQKEGKAQVGKSEEGSPSCEIGQTL